MTRVYSNSGKRTDRFNANRAKVVEGEDTKDAQVIVVGWFLVG